MPASDATAVRRQTRRAAGPWALCLAVAALADQEAGAIPRPNVVFLLSDDQGHDTLSIAGHPLLSTPNLDRLGREGVHFTQACVSTSLCSPSRASFYTGQYARTHGVLHNAMLLSPDAVLFPAVLDAAGYDTAFVGKWHIGEHTGQRLPGFDEFWAYKSQGRYVDNVFRHQGQRLPTAGHVDDVATDFALEFLRRERQAPFLLCLAFKGTHRPRTPPARHAELFADVTFELPINYASLPPFPRRTEWGDLSRRAGEIVADEPSEDWADCFGERWPWVAARPQDGPLRDYLRLVTTLDENVGRILDALDELGLAEDTLVIYASDNGFLDREHGLSGKGTAYESSMRSLLLVRYPRLAARGAVDRPVLNVDVAPTVLELAGLPVPECMQGRSLVPLLERGNQAAWRTEVLYEFYRGRIYGGIPTTLAVRGERYKLITYPGYPSWTELFDLVQDPFEMHDLADSAEHREVRAALERRLAEIEGELSAGPR